MATLAEMKDSIFDLMDDIYSVSRKRHIDGMSIYSYLSVRFPDEPISKCFEVVLDVQRFCSHSASVYPYPDGKKWTVIELERYLEWIEREPKLFGRRKNDD